MLVWLSINLLVINSNAQNIILRGISSLLTQRIIKNQTQDEITSLKNQGLLIHQSQSKLNETYACHQTIPE